MAISFQCGGCGKHYQVANHLAGEQVNCTACEAVMTVPDAAEEAAFVLAQISMPIRNRKPGACFMSQLLG